MENKDVEKILQESVDKIKIKSFSEKWDEISDRLNAPQDAAATEREADAILFNSANENISHNSSRKKIVCIVSAFFLIIILCLAIVLPITLKKNDIPKYLDLEDLSNLYVSESEFYSQLESSDLEIVDFSKYEISSFILFYTPDNIAVGGRVNFVDEETAVFATIDFYDSSVTSSFELEEGYKEYDINGVNVQYNSGISDDCYVIKAKATSANVTYEFECLAFDEDIQNFFEKMFG